MKTNLLLISTGNMQDSKSSTNILYQIVALVTLVAVFVTAFSLHKQTLNLNQKRSELAHLQQDVVLLDKIATDQKARQASLDAITASVPSTYQEFAYVLEKIEQLASDAQQTIEIAPTEAATPEPDSLDTVTLTIKTSGSYSSLTQFLTNLTRLPYHTRLDSIQVDQDGNQVASLISIRLFIIDN